MLKLEAEKRLAGIISWGAVGITILVTDRVSTDPVNVGKMLLLSVLAGGCIGITSNSLKIIFLRNRLAIIMILLFLGFALMSIIYSLNPWERGFYGAFGRNTGLLTYASLAVVFISISLLRQLENVERILKAFFLSGYLNLAYCLFASTGRDIFTWTNPYKKLLGTFGNPDFISAFMGFFIVGLFCLSISKGVHSSVRLFYWVSIVASLYAIKGTAALQGFVICVIGFLIVIFFFIISRDLKPYVVYSYVVSMLILGFIAITGTLQKGPLASLLYKPSVTLRGEYWQAGINMGTDNPFLGVGLDSYGTFYRFYRDKSATIFPGVNTVADTAHNVFIDIFAGTGFPGLISYIGILVLVLISAGRVIINQKTFDPLFVSLFSIWCVYQIQTIVSINQIGLAIWGWVLGGALIAYSKILLGKDTESPKNNDVKSPKKLVSILPGFNKKVRRKQERQEISAILVLTLALGSTLGGLVAAPSFFADTKLRNALGTQDLKKFYSVGLLWPMDSTRTNQALVNMGRREISNDTINLALSSVKKFPAEFPVYFTVWQLSSADSKQKLIYAKKLHTLDPYNPEFAPK